MAAHIAGARPAARARMGALAALLLGALVGVFAPPAARAGSVIPPKSLRQLGGRQVWLPICSRRGVNGSAAWFDNTNTAVMDQVACTSPTWGTITALRLVYAEFDMPQQGEVDRPVTATGDAAIYLPSGNTETVISNGSVASGSTTLNFSATALGAAAISVGQTVSSSGGGIAAGTYVTAVANSFVAGAGNIPNATTVTLSAATTAATSAGQPITFSGSFDPVKFAGVRQFTIVPAHDVLTSDPVAVQIPPSTTFFIRTAASFSGPGMQLMDYPGSGSRLSGEFDSRGTSLNDQTMNPSVLSWTGGGYWCPVAVLALVTLPAGMPQPGAALILGDSIAAGTGDNADSLGLQGYIQRSFENNLSFITTARGSTTAENLALHGDGQYALSVETGITDVLLEDGRNDISAFNSSAATVEGYIQQIATRYTRAGKRVWCFTVPPTTMSNDGWTSLANQAWTVAVANTSAAISSGATSLSMVANPNVAVRQLVSGTGIAAGTTVTAVAGGGATLTLSAPTTAAIASGVQLNFGSGAAAASASEQQRLAYNAYLRQSAAALGCSGVVDIDKVVADPGGSGKWRVDLGAASPDGVHPSAALHQAIVSAGLIKPAMFQPQ